MPSEYRLFASIHDVGPRTETETDRLIDLLGRHVDDRLALLVVPNHWGSAPIIATTPFAARLRTWAEAGFEIFLHGFFHRDCVVHQSLAARARARWMTAGEGEFLGLSRAEAGQRIRSGRALLEDITGRPICGFVAPAWLYGRGSLEALSDCAIPVAEDHLRIWSPLTGAVLSRSPVITWASRTPARLHSSIFAAAALRHLPARDLRIGVHPGDCRSPRLLGSITRTLEVVTASRTPSRYRDVLAA